MDKYEDLFNPSFLKEKTSAARPPLPKDATVTMAYVPIQTEIITYDTAEALDNGTLFPALNKEFKGRMLAK